MNAFDLFATLKLDSSEYEKGLNEAKSEASSAGGKLASGLATAGKVATAAVGAAAAGITALTSKAVSSYADYEQLVGGVETLFAKTDKTFKEMYEDASAAGKTLEEFHAEWFESQSSINKVLENAQKAFQTAGLSANQYMETVTSFSASLLQSLGGDTDAAAEYADMAIRDMSDNANKMGTSMESIQNAYQGFAKQNYTMLDNLKLGYGGTKEEMQRLLDKAEELSGQKFDLSSYADIVDAIHIVQDEMGITGTTAKEAGSTISGSISMAKAAWENLANTIADPDGDLGAAIDNMLTSIVGDGTDSNKGVLGNLMPIIEQSLQGIGQFIEEAAPIITERLPALVDAILPPLIEAAISTVEGLVAALPSILQTLVSMLPDIIDTICQILITNLPMLLDVALQAIVTLASGIAQSLPTLIPQIVDVVMAIVDTLVNNIDMLIDVAIQLIMALVDGVVAATPILIEKFPEIILKIWEAIIRNLPKILQAAVELIMTLIKGIANNYAKVFEVGKQIIDKVKDGFSQKVQDAKNWGRDMIQNFIDGILAKWNDLKASVANVAQSVKDFLGFSEPDKGPLSNFHTYAPDMMELFAKGIRDSKSLVTDALNSVGEDLMSTNFDMSGVIDSSISNRTSLLSSNEFTSVMNSGIIELLKEYLPIIANGNNIYIDKDVLVGSTVSAYNNALGSIYSRGIKR